MAAGTYNFKIEQWADLNKTLTFYTDASKTSTDDISSYTMSMQIRKTKDSPDFIDELTNANSRIDVTNAATGIIILKWTSAQSGAYDFDEAYYDLVFTSGGVKNRKLEGVITLNKGVTK